MGKPKQPDPEPEKVVRALEHNLTVPVSEEETKYRNKNDELPENDSPLECEDLALDILSCNDDQEETLLLHSTFNGNDMVRFGKLLLKQVQEKLIKVEKLAQKEREMNFATFDCKIQASCNVLYGSCQKLEESVTDKLEKPNTMLQATYKLHKEIATQINSEALKIEEAKNDLMKSANKIEETKLARIPSIIQGFDGYLKNQVLSFVPVNGTKSAITN